MQTNASRWGGPGMAAALVLAACSAGAPSEPLDPEPVAPGQCAAPDRYWPLNWTHSSASDAQVLGPYVFGGELLDDEAPVNLWLRAWSEAIEAHGRTALQAPQCGALPVATVTPRAVRTRYADGFAHPKSWCAQWRVVREGEGVDAESSRQPVRLDFRDGTVASLIDSDCEPRELTVADRARLIAVWNERFAPCTLAELADGSLQIGRACAGAFVGSERIHVSAAAPTVSLALGGLSEAGEAGSLFVLAHELAHVLRAHAAALSPRWRTQWFRGPLSGPWPALVSAEEQPALREDYARLQALRGGPGVLSNGALPAPQRAWLVQQLCPRLASGAPEACAEVASACATLRELQIAAAVPIEAVGWSAPSSSAAALHAVERGAAACAAALPHAGWGVGELRAFGVALDAEVAADAPLDELLAQTRAPSMAAEQRLRQLFEEILRGEVGPYTQEREADELGLRWLVELGFDADEVVGGMLEWLLAQGRSFAQPGTPLPLEACAEVLRHGAVDAHGAPQPVWWGDLDWVHGDGCARLTHLLRLARAQGVRAQGARPTPAAPGFEQVRENIQAELDPERASLPLRLRSTPRPAHATRCIAP